MDWAHTPGGCLLQSPQKAAGCIHLRPEEAPTPPDSQSSTGTAAPQASQSQPNFFNSLQNLPGSVHTVQPSLAHPGSQALFSLPPGLSNSLATTPSQGAMLPPGLGASGANGAIQQYPVTGLKRTHEGNSDSNEPQKQQKINDTIGNIKLVPPTHQK